MTEGRAQTLPRGEDPCENSQVEIVFWEQVAATDKHPPPVKDIATEQVVLRCPSKVAASERYSAELSAQKYSYILDNLSLLIAAKDNCS